jgi:hypothetical protein
MPQATLERTARKPKAPARPSTPQRRANTRMVMARGVARRMASGMRTSLRLSWRTGKMVGRAQGTAALAPRVARGWWTGLITRARLAGTRAQMRTVLAWAPMAFAGTRLVARMQQRRPRLRVTNRAAFMAGRSIGRAQGAAGAVRLTPRAVRTARRVGVVRWPFGRRASQGVLQGTGWRLRRTWRWMRSFTLGFALGTIWAYLFAPRTGPGYQALRQSGQETRSA